MAVNEPLLTAREGAKVLGCYYRTLRRWAREGRVPSVRESDSPWVRFRRADLAAFAEARKNPARATAQREAAVLETLTTIEAQLGGAGKPRRATKGTTAKPRRPTRS